MNKAELVNAVASAANLSKADAGRAVDAVVGSVTSALQRGEQVSIIGLVLSVLNTVQHVLDEIQELVLRFGLRQVTFLASKLERHLRKP